MNRPPLASLPSMVYVAGPYAAYTLEDGTHVSEAENLRRAAALARWLFSVARLPILPHHQGRAIFGEDSDPRARRQALQWCERSVRQLADLSRESGHCGLVAIRREDGTLSTGTAVEVGTWLLVQRTPKRLHRHTWAEWCALSRQHGEPMVERVGDHLHQHGPCTAGGATVRNRLDGLPAWLQAAMQDRLDEGERKYGAQLTVGWPDAKLAGFQEALDGLAYAIADDDHEGVALWVSMCIRLRSRLGGGAS